MSLSALKKDFSFISGGAARHGGLIREKNT